MSGLPADIATQLKPDAAVEKMEPPEIVARTRTKLSSRANISNVWCHCHKQISAKGTPMIHVLGLWTRS